MKQIVVLSGKGGTGKTVISAALAVLSENKIMVDCDVDAADLHLLLHPQVKERREFRSGMTAVIDEKLCVKCRKCILACRFEAICGDFRVRDVSCEGCGLCGHICPYGAVRMEENLSGEWFISDTRYGPFVHARLGVAQENSGKLVAKIKEAAGMIAAARSLDYMIVDGPPGIGCPVIASLSGADLALVVTEPTLSGLHDAQRVMEVAEHFRIPVDLVINKCDLNTAMTEKIELFCRQRNIPVIGKIAFDKAVVEALVAGKTIAEGPCSQAAEEVKKIWQRLKG
jgi:MinD superfamily P-loop ATPase